MEEKMKEWVIDTEGILKITNTYLIIEVLEEEERK